MLNEVLYMSGLSALVYNDCCCYQGAVDPVVMILYFHSINIFLMHPHKNEMKWVYIRPEDWTFTANPYVQKSFLTYYTLGMKGEEGHLHVRTHPLAKIKEYILQ
jgi:hypothetical protein